MDVRTRAVPEEYKAVAAALDMNTVRELLGDDYVEGILLKFSKPYSFIILSHFHFFVKHINYNFLQLFIVRIEFIMVIRVSIKHFLTQRKIS